VIPYAFIQGWRAHAPWADDAMVEQDLVISRALVNIYSDPVLQRRLAFRGGTALHKLYLHPAARYSEDIDLVQMEPGPIGSTLDRVRRTLDPWLGSPKRKFKEGRVNLVYRFSSEGAHPIPMRLKVEINSREHFTHLGFTTTRLAIGSDWYTGAAHITTYDLDELLGTKFRALYQRKKGRDLFDLALGLDGGANPSRVIACFDRYLEEGGHRVSRAQFERNLHEKRTDPLFRGDVAPLLRPGLAWDPDAALDQVLKTLVALLPGGPLRGTAEEKPR